MTHTFFKPAMTDTFFRPLCKIATRTYNIAEQLGKHHPDYSDLHQIVDEIDELINLIAVD